MKIPKLLTTLLLASSAAWAGATTTEQEFEISEEGTVSSGGCGDFGNKMEGIFNENRALFKMPGGVTTQDGSDMSNFFDYLFGQYTRLATAKNIAGTTSIMKPQMFCNGSNTTISSTGAQLNIVSCKHFAGLFDYTNILGFGFTMVAKTTPPGAYSACFGFEINDKDSFTFGIAQAGIIPPMPIVPEPLYVKVVGNAFVFSVDRKLSRVTYNKMIDGSKDEDNNLMPAANKTVFGHCMISATGDAGLSVGAHLKVALIIDGYILLDADANEDGLAHQVADISDADDFAMLVSTRSGPKVTWMFRDGKGNNAEQVLDFSKAVHQDIDVYLEVNGDKTEFQFARSLNLSLRQICHITPFMKILCFIFKDKDGMSAAVRVFGNGDAIGLQYEIDARLEFNIDENFKAFLEDIGVETPDKLLSLSASLGVYLYIDLTDAGQFDLCLSSKKKQWCLSEMKGLCFNDDMCSAGKFCNLVFHCEKKKDLGGSCVKDSGCASDKCAFNSRCAECGGLNRQSNCGPDRWCRDTGFAKAYMCREKNELGESCIHDDICKSGICATNSRCGQCRGLNTQSNCGSDRWCKDTGFAKAYMCREKNELGESCLTDDICKSGKCGANKRCGQCKGLNTQSNCGSDRWCKDTGVAKAYMCREKNELGESCLTDDICKSGKCGANKRCGQCKGLNKQSNCGSGRWCKDTGLGKPYMCRDKNDLGQSCGNDDICKSGKCGANKRCGECKGLNKQSNCGSGRWCKDTGAGKPYRCRNKNDLGQSCGNDDICKSGKCGANKRCGECKGLNQQSNCGSGRWCKDTGAGKPYRCRDKVGNGTACGTNSVCKSGNCGIKLFGKWRKTGVGQCF